MLGSRREGITPSLLNTVHPRTRQPCDAAAHSLAPSAECGKIGRFRLVTLRFMVGTLTLGLNGAARSAPSSGRLLPCRATALAVRPRHSGRSMPGGSGGTASNTRHRGGRNRSAAGCRRARPITPLPRTLRHTVGRTVCRTLGRTSAVRYNQLAHRTALEHIRNGS